MIKFTIGLEPRSKKNSQQLYKDRNTGRTFIAPSRAYKQYEKDSRWFMPKVGKPINTPVNVCARFYMGTRRRVDMVNLQEALLDVLVAHGVLEDDNCKIVVGMDGSRVLYDKSNPRTEVFIEDVAVESPYSDTIYAIIDRYRKEKENG